MAKELNFKKLAERMNLQDKAKILFADIDKRAETNGLERILTTTEREAIIKDAQNNGQANDLVQLKKFYDIAMLLVFDLQTNFLEFALLKNVLIGLIVSITIKGASDIIIEEIICELAFSKEPNPEKANILLIFLNQKYKSNKTLNLYDIFSPSVLDIENYIKLNSQNLPEPNPLIQTTFIKTVEQVKIYNKIKYQINYIARDLLEVSFLGDKDKKRISYYQKNIYEFVNLEGIFGFINELKKIDEQNLFKKTNLTEPRFFEIVKNIKEEVELTEKEKEEAKLEVDKILGGLR